MGRHLFYLALVVLSMGLEMALTGPAILGKQAADSPSLERVKRDDRTVGEDIKDQVNEWAEDAEEFANDTWEKVWSGRCVVDDSCSAVSYCHIEDEKYDVIGECRMTWWFLLILAAVVVFLLSSLISCLCCPCCCLYDCCMGICDCLCCGCCSKRGYRLAGS